MGAKKKSPFILRRIILGPNPFAFDFTKKKPGWEQTHPGFFICISTKTNGGEKGLHAFGRSGGSISSRSGRISGGSFGGGGFTSVFSGFFATGKANQRHGQNHGGQQQIETGHFILLRIESAP
ncbi:MAG: hypothetical protein OEW12_00485 [Deltaproteobacteria bacterium]|nr:hypothetical protein [Deltaproteobacteria bacterium]